MFYWGHGVWTPWNWGLDLIGILVSVVIVVIIVRIILRVVRGDSFHHHHRHWDDWNGDAKNTAMKILDERYARGEISDEEYRNKKENLK